MTRESGWRAAVALTVVVTLGALPVGGSATDEVFGSEFQLPPDALGSRPWSLVADMDDGELKQRLAACRYGPFFRSRFSIGHRGAPLAYPEHTRESFLAAIRQGAGIVECDVTFTADLELVCRHSQCDLHTTTNILETPLASRCSEPFSPADPASGRPAGARCCTSDLNLQEFRSLCGRMDFANPAATTVADYLASPPGDHYKGCGRLMTHAESIELFDGHGVDMAPELKSPQVPMPFGGSFSQAQFASRMIEEYRAAGVAPGRVWPQSFDLGDIRHWIAAEPRYAGQAVYLDARFDAGLADVADPDSYEPSMKQLASDGVSIVAPPIWVLLALDAEGNIVPSAYARAARAAGLEIITWTLERSGSLAVGGGGYYRSIRDAIDNDGDVYAVLEVLAFDVGVIGVFSDWPATVTYYASCRSGERSPGDDESQQVGHDVDGEQNRDPQRGRTDFPRAAEQADR